MVIKSLTFEVAIIVLDKVNEDEFFGSLWERWEIVFLWRFFERCWELYFDYTCWAYAFDREFCIVEFIERLDWTKDFYSIKVFLLVGRFNNFKVNSTLSESCVVSDIKHTKNDWVIKGWIFKGRIELEADCLQPIIDRVVTKKFWTLEVDVS